MALLPNFTHHPEIAPRRKLYFEDLEAFTKTLPKDSRYRLPPDHEEYLPSAKHPDFKWKTYYPRDYFQLFRDAAKRPQETREKDFKSLIRETFLSCSKGRTVLVSSATGNSFLFFKLADIFKKKSGTNEVCTEHS